MHYMARMKVVTVIGWVFVIVLLAATDVRAAQQPLFLVESGIRPAPTNVSLRVDDRSGEIVGLYVENDYYSAAEIKVGAKIKIDGIDCNKDVLRIQGANIDPHLGGTLVLTFLYDGIRNKYRQIELDLRQENGHWQVYQPGSNKPVSVLQMVKRTVFGVTIGIDKIKVKA